MALGRTSAPTAPQPRCWGRWRGGRRQARLLVRALGVAGGADVVVTREKGKNGRLMKALAAQGIQALELPLIETTPTATRGELVPLLRGGGHDWVAVTSPEAAAVLLELWAQAGKPHVRVASVGEGTTRILREAGTLGAGIELGFQPSVANAETLAAELPRGSGEGSRVLYPASAKAGDTLRAALEARGEAFVLERVDTYDTLPVEGVSEQELDAAVAARVLAVASPSALKAWHRLSEGRDTSHQRIACIGSTSAEAAKKLGYPRVFFPPNPGLEGFVGAIQEALEAS